MSTVITAPDISGINKLFEIYQSLPESNHLITSITLFYQFLSVNTAERQLFLEKHCDFDFMYVGTTVILKLSPKND